MAISSEREPVGKSVIREAHEAMEAVGIDMPVRRKILRGWQTEWAITLAGYGRWRKRVGDGDGAMIPSLGGYLYETWRAMEAERKAKGRDYLEWPEEFLRWWSREKRVDRDAREIHAAAVAARPAAPPQAPRVTIPAPVSETSLLDPMTIPESERDALLQQALLAVYADLPGPALQRARGLVEKQGWKHPRVQAVAARIWHASELARGQERSRKEA